MIGNREDIEKEIADIERRLAQLKGPKTPPLSLELVLSMA